MTQDANIVSTKFHKSVIKSRLAMTYEAVQNKNRQCGRPGCACQKSSDSLQTLKDIETETGWQWLPCAPASSDRAVAPIEVQTKVMRETNSMVEEFMLAANISAAKRIFEVFPDCAMLRRHPAPPPSNFDPLVKAARQQGYHIVVDSGKQLADKNQVLSEMVQKGPNEPKNYFHQ